MSAFLRIVLWLALLLFVLPIVCVNVTTAGLLTEEYAEMFHGGISMFLGLYALGMLNFDAMPKPPATLPHPSSRWPARQSGEP